MNITIVNEDKVVMIDGEGTNFDFTLDDNIWAIQWDGTKGEVEYKDNTPNLELTDFTEYQYLVDGFNTENARLAEVSAQAAIDAEAALTYADKRKAKYEELNQFEMQYDDSVNGTTTWVDTIAAIKQEFPK